MTQAGATTNRREKAGNKLARLDVDAWRIAVPILSSAALGIYGVIAAGDDDRAILFIPLVAVAFGFIVFWLLLDRLDSRLNESLDRRLPPVEYLAERADVELELTRLVERADAFVVVVGGRSRNSQYLQTIETKVETGSTAYWRLLMAGQPISHEICEHVRRLLPVAEAEIRVIDRPGYTQVTLTDAGFLSVLPTPGHGLTGIFVPNPEAAGRLFVYHMQVFNAAHALDDERAVQQMCEVCGQQAPDTSARTEPTGV